MLKDKDFKYRYSSGKTDMPINFCELALSNSIKLDLGLGYFSTASFNVLSVGFAHFISNGGNMRLYINQHLTEDDYKLLQSDETIDFEEYILQSFYSLKRILKERDEHFFKCLSFLIQSNRIEIKIVVPKEGGIAHEKFGVFTDGYSNKVSFIGSMNLTAAALLAKNLETIECTCSWNGEDSRERVETSEQDFLEIWTGANEGVLVFPAKKFCKEIVKTYPKVDLNELLQQEKEIIKKWSNKIRGEIKIEPTQRTIREPHFPDKYPDGARPYQIQAYEAWVKNGKQGIFAMATGTGKTITSLNCALQEYRQDNLYQLLILVPTIALVEQWIDEIGLFDFRNPIRIYSENKQWKKEIINLRDKIKNGRKENFVIISTYQSFTHKSFQDILFQLPDTMLLIADEAHNIGSQKVREAFRKMKIQKRIALSATPKRIYDEEGTTELENFFNDKPRYIDGEIQYVYNFSMKEAIDKGRLTQYLYYPKMAKLNENEMLKYVEYTKKLNNLIDKETGGYKDKKKAEQYLMLRKQVLHKAEDKIRVLKEIISEIGQENLKYCFVFAPEGKINEGDKNDAKKYSETDNSTEEVDTILQKMLDTINDKFPQTACNTYTGNDDKKDRSAKLKGFENGIINVLLAMKCLDEGVDVPRAQYGIFASSTGNPRQFIQRRGRLLRLYDDGKFKKDFAYIYDMIVVPDFQSAHYSKEFYKTEQSLVKGELARVAYFANLATNKLSAKEALKELEERYQLNLSELILSINQ